MSKTVEFFAIRRAYELIYRQCVLKYFLFAKGNSQEKEFFSSLANFCKMYMLQVKNNFYHQQNKRKLVYHRVLCPNESKLLEKRKCFLNEAFMLGYSGNSLKKDTVYVKQSEKEKVAIMSLEEAILFFNEIADIISHEDAFLIILEKLRALFEKYKQPFIVS